MLIRELYEDGDRSTLRANPISPGAQHCQPGEAEMHLVLTLTVGGEGSGESFEDKGEAR